MKFASPETFPSSAGGPVYRTNSETEIMNTTIARPISASSCLNSYISGYIQKLNLEI